MRYVYDSDLHIHSQLSACSGDPLQTNERILRYAEENKLKTICLTDHMWDERVPGFSSCGCYDTQNFAHVCKAKPLPQSENVRFLFGCETEMDQYLTIAISKERFKETDFVVIPTTHMHFVGFTISAEEGATAKGRAGAWVKRFEKLLSSDLPFRKIGVAHLACGLIAPTREMFLDTMQLIPTDEMYRLFKKAAALGIGIELNSGDMSYAESEKDVVLKPFRIAKECGCKFYTGSDAHHPFELDKAKGIFERAIDVLELEETDKFVLKI